MGVIGKPDLCVLVTGHFLICHSDHVKLFEYASSIGSLIVGINGTRVHKEKYGDRGIPVADREYIIRSCKYVKDVVVFEEDTPAQLILRLKPDFYVKGPDYRGVLLPEQEACNDVGCVILFRPGGEEIHSKRFLSL